LLDPAGSIVELALVYLAFPCHTGIYRGISHSGVCEFDDYRGRPFKRSFLREPSYVGYFCLRDDRMVICEYLFDGCLLVFHVN
jgi:hypothetical protein